MSSDARACTTKRSRRQIEAEETEHGEGGGSPPPCHARPLQRQRGASHTAPAKVEQEGEDTKDEVLSQYLHQDVFAANNDLCAGRNPQACADCSACPAGQAFSGSRHTPDGPAAFPFRTDKAQLLPLFKHRLKLPATNAHIIHRMSLWVQFQ